MEFPEDLRYTREHEWVRVESGHARVGITDFAQDALGDVVYVDAPEVGTEVKAGEPFGEVESTKSVSDVYSPVTGTVAERNPLLADSPQLVNEDPYGQGWMVVVEMSDPGQVEALMDASAYRDFTRTEPTD
ncbi:MAG TPA: glycine cleavage system protein GcvH [Actinomycetota bacterium]|jgi:glycine cleavage system H protein